MTGAFCMEPSFLRWRLRTDEVRFSKTKTKTKTKEREKPMGMFSGEDMGNQHGSKGGVYFAEGHYICRLLKLSVEKTFKGRFFFCETEILDVLEPTEKTLSKKARPTITVTAGGDKFEQYKSTFLGNMADCMRGILACKSVATGEPATPETVEFDDEIANECIDPKDPYELVGTVFGVYAYEGKKKNGDPITKFTYFVPDNIEDYLESENDAA